MCLYAGLARQVDAVGPTKQTDGFVLPNIERQVCFVWSKTTSLCWSQKTGIAQIFIYSKPPGIFFVVDTLCTRSGLTFHAFVGILGRVFFRCGFLVLIYSQCSVGC